MGLRIGRMGRLAALVAAVAWWSTPAIGQTVITAGGQGVQAPMNFVATDGTIAGVVVDILAAIAADQGFVVQHVTGLAVGDTVDAILAGQIDITEGTFAVTPERAALVAFSIPYMIQGEALVVRRDDPVDYRSLADLGGTAVGTVRGSNYVGLLNAYPPDTFSEIRQYDYPPDVLAAVIAGEIRGGVYGAPIATWDIQQGGYGDVLRLAENYRPASTNVYAFAMRKEDTVLLDAVNESLRTMLENGTIRAIFERYGLPYADYTR